MPLEISDGLIITPKRPRAARRATRATATRDITPAPQFTNPLGVQRIRQGNRRKWCWAACGTMLGRFLDSATPRRMCHLVGFVRETLHGKPVGLDCCVAQVDNISECVETTCESVEEIDTLFKNFLNLDAQRTGRIAPDALKQEINEGRPVQVGFEWDGSTADDVRGHVILVEGWVSVPQPGGVAEDFFIILDPFQDYGPGEGPPVDSRVSYDSLRVAYNNDGQWLHTWTGLRRKDGGI
ncbi:MAG TPA: papain-like cysteine protease family protein [Pyrinomonadaceae bacterium]|jgi:hypothetical protein|nr:papain-like cysteine protease family protein [Pyrinomonadaceae bacterium]